MNSTRCSSNHAAADLETDAIAVSRFMLCSCNICGVMISHALALVTLLHPEVGIVSPRIAAAIQALVVLMTAGVCLSSIQFQVMMVSPSNSSCGHLRAVAPERSG